MSRKAQRTQGKGALEVLEEAFHLLRRVPGSSFAAYYAGSAAFVLAFLYFWADMSRGAFARGRVVEASLVVSLLFLWMKCWQAVFAARIRSLLADGPPPSWTPRRVLRLAAAQAAIQPAGLLVLPVALLLTLPFGWAFAYYQNATLFGSGEERDLKVVTRKAREQAMLFPRQNHAVLAVLALFSVVVFLNIATLLYLAPHLVHLLSGTESMFTRASGRVLNTTFLAASLGMTYLAIDPVTKCVYVLRCFYGGSVLTGEDLEADLRNIRFRTKMAASVLVFLLLTGSLSPAIGGEAVAPERLDRSISEVVSRREYAWRLPRAEQDSGKQKGPVAEFIAGAIDTVAGWLRPVKSFVRKIVEWLWENVIKKFAEGRQDRPRAEGWPQSVFILLYGLLAVAASLLGILLFRAWKKRGGTQRIQRAEEVVRTPDLTRQDVAADELPVNSWLDLGADLMKRGELRLALRAFYLASLARLAEDGRITIALFKSNREYERELSRKAHTLPDLVSAFSENVSIVERAWYGMHEVPDGLLQRFLRNQERIMADAQRA